MMMWAVPATLSFHAHAPALLPAARPQRCSPPASIEFEEEEYLFDLERQLRNSAGGRGARPNTRRPRVAPSVDFITEREPRGSRESMRVGNLWNRILRRYNEYLATPGRELLLGACTLLFGFFLAGALSTIFGAKGFWEPTIALGPLVVYELITKELYSREPSARTITLKLLNAMKIGFLFGCTIDAIKLAG